MSKELTHFDAAGGSRMVDIGEKSVTLRTARAKGKVEMAAETAALIQSGGSKKGNVLEVARLAAIMAAKKTADLIPLCHPLSLDGIEISFSFLGPTTLQLEAVVKVTAKTGVEMEALTAVTVGALTVYDMCKSVDRGMVISDIQLEEKSGGRSGHFKRSEDQE